MMWCGEPNGRLRSGGVSGVLREITMAMVGQSSSGEKAEQEQG